MFNDTKRLLRRVGIVTVASLVAATASAVLTSATANAGATAESGVVAGPGAIVSPSVVAESGVVAASGDGRYLSRSSASTPGVTGLPGPATAPATVSGALPRLTMRVTDPVAAKRSGVNPDAVAGSYVCTPSLTYAVGGIGEDDFLEETVDVTYGGAVSCNITLDAIDLLTAVLDRTAAFNGETFDGRQISTGSYFYDEGVRSGSSAGALRVNAHDYNGGRRIEPAIELFLLAPEGIAWGPCESIPGLRYILCEGVNTDLLHVVMGTGNVQTGLTKACRDQRGGLNPEQDRLPRTFGGSTPVSTQFIRRITTIKDKVKLLKRDLCSVTTSAAATTFADQRGLDLWSTAVTAAKANQAQGDDRPLYWARLAMTAALLQWRPTFTVDRNALQTSLDKSGRGMTSHTFGASAKRALISGFDPFLLDQSPNALFRSNPSGAAVLRLDGAFVAGAEVQAVIFPVRYDDFDAGLVEDIFRPHLQGDAQQATIMTTVSQGGTRFDLEYYNGRRRSSDAPDNRGRFGGGSIANPIEPPGIAAGAEFVTTTLPVDRMIVAGTYGVAVHTQVWEKGAGQPKPDGPNIGTMAAEGSGGGFLSNEIAYRVTRLRDSRGVTIPAGHVHIPTIWLPSSATDTRVDAERTAVATQYQSILTAGINNATIAPMRLTTDRTTYRVGDTPVYTVTGGPLSKPIKWTSTRNGTLTTEIDTLYGHSTNTTGGFNGSYHAWSQAGTWVKYVRIDGRLTSVTVTVTT